MSRPLRSYNRQVRIVGEGLHPITRAWFASRFAAPSAAQEKAWPHVLAGRSTLISAPTGSGKTLAAFLCAIDRLVFQHTPRATRGRSRGSSEDRGVRVLYISPVKALARDVERNLQEPLSAICDLASAQNAVFYRPAVAVRSGDTPQAERQRMRRNPPDILITTPESLFLILTSDARRMLASVETIIVDEIHAIVGTKRGAHLAVSLERVARLAARPVQRVGLSATCRPLDLVARFLAGSRGPKVEVVDAPIRRAFDVRVESAVPDMTSLPRERVESSGSGSAGHGPWKGTGTAASGRDIRAEAVRGASADSLATSPAEGAPSIWPSIHARALELIRAHRSTIVFVNARRAAERVASAINELAGGETCRAHHGSLAREERELVEGALKDGSLRAVVATSSLELGIDMGLVDLVIQIETPSSVSSTIQRVGRASHHLGGVPKALLFPVYRGDLLAAASTVKALHQGDIEPVTLPRNPLDVLAQQILSILVSGPMDIDDLFSLVRKAAPYSGLPRASFEGVLDMLAGRYPSHEFRDLRPRIVWNRSTGELRARAGARMLLFANAGTIPDRGLFGVFLAANRTNGETGSRSLSRRVGELDEGMVFESRAGDIVMLGASSWRIDEIDKDRVIVVPAPGLRGRMPFWKADRPPRPVENAKRIGALARKIAGLSEARGRELLENGYSLDPSAARNLASYIAEQKERGALPTDKTVVLERMRDEMGDLRLCLLSSFGGRVHQPLALAITRRMRACGAEVEATVSDDGIILRLPDRETTPGFQDLLPPSRELERLVREELSESTLFAARFREAAGRSLLLPRRRPGSRSPFWAQRQRAHSLLSVASRFKEFPLILEAYRECLSEDFDVAATIDILRGIEKREIRAITVDVERPSPYATALLFGYVATVMYGEDAPLAERRAHALAIDESQLRALLGETAFQDLLDPKVMAEVHAELQSLTPSRRIRTLDGLHDTLLRIGDLSESEVEGRAAGPSVAGFVDVLVREKRAAFVAIGVESRLIAAEDAGLYRSAAGITLPEGLPPAFSEAVPDARVGLLRRFAQTRGPFSTADAVARYGLSRDVVAETLERLESRGDLYRGPFTPDAVDVEWCDAAVLKRIRRQSLAKARGEVSAVDSRDYARFLVAWNGLGDEASHGGDRIEALLAAVEQIQGAAIPTSALEQDVLLSRVPEYRGQDLDVLVSRGDVVVEGRGALNTRDGRVALYIGPHRDALGATPFEPCVGEPFARIRSVLAGRGALFFPEIARALPDLRSHDLIDALWSLFWNGEVTNDAVSALRARTAGASVSASRRIVASTMNRYRSRFDIPREAVGRFSLLTPPGGDRAEVALASIEQWLARYGVLTREAVMAEGCTGGFSGIYPVLRALEERGQVRRGYFVEGLGALQFADPAAVDRLREIKAARDSGQSVVLAATDPAQPFGATLRWPEWTKGEGERRAHHHVTIADGTLTALLAGEGSRVLVHLPDNEGESARLARLTARAIAAWMRRGAIRIIGHAPSPRALNQGLLAAALRSEGLSPSGPGFRL